MKVLIIGTGKIGCGYLAPMFAEAGWSVVLAARTGLTVDRMLSAGAFSVRVTGGGGLRNYQVPQVVVTGTRGFDHQVAQADLIATAVGVDKVVGLAPALAAALAARPAGAALDVWTVENQDRAADLEVAVRSVAAQNGLEHPRVGFAGAIAEVVVGRGGWDQPGRVEFVGDNTRSLSVDRTRLVSPLPRLPGVRGTSQYQARLHEKLFVFNTGHALCAYLGALRGHHTIDRAVVDPALRPLVVGCLLESRRALLTTYPRLGNDQTGPVAQALKRFGDEELADPIARVARDPIRKLGRTDRLVGPALMVEAANGELPAHFSLGIAAALLYRSDTDQQATALAAMLAERGVAPVIEEVCGLSPTDGIGGAVASRYHGFILTDDGAVFPPVHEVAG